MCIRDRYRRGREGRFSSLAFLATCRKETDEYNGLPEWFQANRGIYGWLMNGTRRIIYITLGTFFLILGAIGIFVPLLPTTPFWLLTCWFYVRSSEKLYNRVMSNRYFGPHIKGFVEDKAIPLRSKIITIAIMWLSTIITSLLLVGYWWVKALLGLISIGVSWHILSYPTKKE